MSLPKSVRLVEVGPRDGLQNEKQPISVADKVRLVDDLSAAGLGYVEVGSFVSPKWVPQMAGSADVFAAIQRQPGVTYAALTPNLKGFEAALQAEVEEVAVFAAASEAFSQKNINCSIAESLERFVPLMEAAKAAKARARLCVLRARLPLRRRDRPGAGRQRRPRAVRHGLLRGIARRHHRHRHAGQDPPPDQRGRPRHPRHLLAGHFHDTYGQALANIYASLLEGIQVFDSSVAGLGGCPYAKGATGNVATEDVLYMLQGLGIDTGIDMDKLIAAGQRICEVLGKANGSRVARARLSR